VFPNKKREGIDTFVALYVAETPKASIKDQELQLPIILLSIVAHSFFWTTFLEKAV